MPPAHSRQGQHIAEAKWTIFLSENASDTDNPLLIMSEEADTWSLPWNTKLGPLQFATKEVS